MVVLFIWVISFYGHAPLKSGLFLLNLDSSDTHIHSVETKRCRVDNDSATYLWHCRLGHIGIKRMKKLHSDGLLESLDYESLGTCEPCLMGKMTKTPFSGTMERELICWKSYILMYVVQWILRLVAGIIIFSPSQMIWADMVYLLNET